MRPRNFLTLLVLMLALPLALAACGDDDGDGGSATTATGGPAETTTDTGGDGDGAAAGGAAGKSVTITAAADGSLAYDEESVTAKAGEIEINFDNPSDVIHDVVIEDGGTDVGGTDRVTNGSTSVKVDLEPGEYVFYCSLTGHRTAGMEGTLIVE